ncbi:MAG TPA: hypothetical protein VGS08_04450, partial [Candidatus Saccharimonadales bacterium]|nr:hypothetical protein [Candidatus Saccharimonadales bacterium]
RLKVALTLQFEFEDGQRTVTFEKGEAILVWRCWQLGLHDVVRRLDRNGFRLSHLSQSDDHEYILAVSQVVCD